MRVRRHAIAERQQLLLRLTRQIRERSGVQPRARRSAAGRPAGPGGPGTRPGHRPGDPWRRTWRRPAHGRRRRRRPRAAAQGRAAPAAPSASRQRAPGAPAAEPHDGPEEDPRLRSGVACRSPCATRRRGPGHRPRRTRCGSGAGAGPWLPGGRRSGRCLRRRRSKAPHARPSPTPGRTTGPRCAPDGPCSDGTSAPRRPGNRPRRRPDRRLRQPPDLTRRHTRLAVGRVHDKGARLIHVAGHAATGLPARLPLHAAAKRGRPTSSPRVQHGAVVPRDELLVTNPQRGNRSPRPPHHGLQAGPVPPRLTLRAPRHREATRRVRR